jgi:hypothetical protein
MQLKSIFPFYGEPTTAAADTIIATETEFRGDIRSEQKIQINGAIIGNVIGPSGAEHCITVGAQLLGMMKTKSGPAAQAPEQTAQKQAKAD